MEVDQGVFRLVSMASQSVGSRAQASFGHSFGLNSYTTTVATGKRNGLDLDGGVETVQHDKNGKLIGNPAQCDWLKDGT